MTKSPCHIFECATAMGLSCGRGLVLWLKRWGRQQPHYSDMKASRKKRVHNTFKHSKARWIPVLSRDAAHLSLRQDHVKKERQPIKMSDKCWAESWTIWGGRGHDWQYSSCLCEKTCGFNGLFCFSVLEYACSVESDKCTIYSLKDLMKVTLTEMSHL